MNTQSSAHIAETAQVGESSSFGRRISMSNSRIAEAANMAFHGAAAAAASPEDIPENPLLAECSRIALRKRKAGSGVPLMVSCNSAFLSGIFADIAQANASSNDPSSENNHQVSFSNDDQNQEEVVSHSHKKSRISLTKSLSRSSKSYRSLAEASVEIEDQQPPDRPQTTSPILDATAVADEPRTKIPKHSSLEFQLHCVSQDNGFEVTPLKSPLTDEDYSDVLAFPHLPATVSSSSCSSTNLTRATSARLQASALEISSNNLGRGDDTESYGWFIETDDVDGGASCANPLDTSYRRSEMSELAFKAPTAPKQVDYDAEVEWARAADTVDDVLGDFF